MKPLGDDLLNAYLDNELPDDERAAIENALNADTAAQRRLAQLRRNDALLQQVYQALDDRPVPDGLTSRILATGSAPANESGRGRVVAFDPRRRTFSRTVLWAASMAAALVLVLGPLHGLESLRGPQYRHAGQILAAHMISPKNPLYAMLEKTPSAHAVVLSAKNALTARPVMTLRLADGRLCREVLVQDKATVGQALVCHEGVGWTVRLRGSIKPVDGSGGYRTASGNSAFDAGLDSLGAQDPLDARQEAALIAGHWKASAPGE